MSGKTSDWNMLMWVVLSVILTVGGALGLGLGWLIWA